MSASIFSYFQAAVSGLLMKSFTANGIQTAERQRARERENERERERFLQCWAALSIKTETLSGLEHTELRFWYFPGSFSKICFFFPGKIPEGSRDPRMCLCVHILKTIMCPKPHPNRYYRETTASTFQLFLPVTFHRCKTTTGGGDHAPPVYKNMG